MKNKIKLLFVAALPLLLSGCWNTGTTELVGIITQVSDDGAFWPTHEISLHPVDAKGVMVATIYAASVDGNDNIRKEALYQQLRACQEAGTRVKVTLHHEAFSAPWRGEHSWFVDKVEALP